MIKTSRDSGEGERLSTTMSIKRKVLLLTGLPDALWCRQGVTEDALMPQASEAMDHLSSPVQNHTLDLVLTVV